MEGGGERMKFIFYWMVDLAPLLATVIAMLALFQARKINKELLLQNKAIQQFNVQNEEKRLILDTHSDIVVTEVHLEYITEFGKENLKHGTFCFSDNLDDKMVDLKFKLNFFAKSDKAAFLKEGKIKNLTISCEGSFLVATKVVHYKSEDETVYDIIKKDFPGTTIYRQTEEEYRKYNLAWTLFCEIKHENAKKILQSVLSGDSDLQIRVSYTNIFGVVSTIWHALSSQFSESPNNPSKHISSGNVQKISHLESIKIVERERNIIKPTPQ